MDNAVLNKAEGLLEKMIEMVDRGVDAAPGVLSDLAREYTYYFVIEELPIIRFAILIGIIGIWITCVKLRRTAIKKEQHDEKEFCETFIVLSVFGVIVSFFLLLDGVRVAAQAHFAPKAFLIEKIRNK